MNFPIRNLTLAVITMISTQALAQVRGPHSVAREAFQLADELRYNENMLSEKQKVEISQLLRQARQVMMGGGPSQYICVSRDNDNAQPYVFAIRQGVQTTRIKGEQFSTMQACQDGITKMIPMRNGSSLTCASRDSDGAQPFVIGLIQDGVLSKFPDTQVSTMDQCRDLMAKAVQSLNRGKMTLCVSRDRDGAQPYVAAEIDLQTRSVTKGSDTFSDMNSCNAFLRGQ